MRRHRRGWFKFDWLKFTAKKCRLEDRGGQLVEFAVALPLLVVFVVGIFDFSGAFTLKQKLTDAARDAARVAAADPITDLDWTVPMSVSDAFYTVDNSLLGNQINDCGITINNVSVTRPLTWTFAASGNNCPSAGLTIWINRGYYFPVTSTQPAASDCSVQALGGQTAVIATCVSIQYGYTWRFGRAASLLGSTNPLPSTIRVTAVAMNEN